MNDFKAFASSIAVHFAFMSQSELFRTDVDGDAVWQAYLAAFPPGTNPIYRTKTEHDGSYDKSFIRRLGNVVAINAEGELVSIWDAPNLQYPYDVVAGELSARVRSRPVVELFRCKESMLGYTRTLQELTEGGTKEWFHFHANISAQHRASDVGAQVGAAKTTVQVMRRGFEEITPEAVNTALELIEQGTLYRGAEFDANVRAFRTVQTKFKERCSELDKSVLLWSYYRMPVARLRNTVIGTLLTDLSEGKDIEFAVKSYETKVAPTNYKRPTALITKGMVEQATKTIAALGLEPALERRFAKLSDVSVNNVLWVDNNVKPRMKDGVADLLMKEVKAAPVTDLKPMPVDIGAFMSNVLPAAQRVEMFFANGLQSNLVSLTAPVNQDVQPIFKWGNNFGWSYVGNITDSIKERVKAAGGNTNAKLRVSLAWFNHDDLDLHAHCPDGHVYYAQKTGRSSYVRAGKNGQILDVDMNAGRGTTRTPVENLSWIDPINGSYRIRVHQFCKRETSNIGFTIELEHDGRVTQYSYHKAVVNNSLVDVMSFTVKNGVVVDLKIDNKDIVGQGISQEKWNLPTEQFVPVNTVLQSPNHWDDRKVGNKHWFFVLKDCLNDEPTRGIYNEFLRPELEQHRKVFEVLGNKTKCPPSAEQLSGLGFSSTKRDSVIVKVTDSKSTRAYQVNF